MFSLDVFITIMPDLVLLCLCCRRPHRPAYLISSLSSTSLIISFVDPIILLLCRISAAAVLTAPHIHFHIRCHPYPPFLSSSVSDYAPHQPAFPLPLSSAAVFAIPHLCLHHPYFFKSLPRLYCCCFHRPASLPLSCSLTAPPLCPALPLLLSNSTKDLGRRIPVGPAFAFRSGGHHCPSSWATTCHNIGPLMFFVWAPKTLATVCVPVLGQHIFLLGAPRLFGIRLFPVPLFIGCCCCTRTKALNRST